MCPSYFAWGLRWICLRQWQVSLWLNTRASLFRTRACPWSCKVFQVLRVELTNIGTRLLVCLWVLFVFAAGLSTFHQIALFVFTQTNWLCHKCGIQGIGEQWWLLDVCPIDSVLFCCDYPLMKEPNVSACSWRALLRESEGTSLAGSFCPDFHLTATWDRRNLAAHTH